MDAEAHEVWPAALARVPVPLLAVALDAVVEELLVHLHKELEGIVDQAIDGLVPMGLGVAIEGGKYHGQQLCRVVAHQAHDVLIVPVVQRTLGHLG